MWNYQRDAERPEGRFWNLAHLQSKLEETSEHLYACKLGDFQSDQKISWILSSTKWNTSSQPKPHGKPQIPVPPCATPGATQHPNDELFKVHRAAAVQVDFAPVAFQTTLRHVRRIWDLQDATDHLQFTTSRRGSETERKQRVVLDSERMTYYYLITIDIAIIMWEYI